MSADNYGIIHRTYDGRFGVTSFFASVTDSTYPRNPDITCDTLTEAVDYAQEQCYEYGWSYSPELNNEILRSMENHPSKGGHNG